MHAFTIPLCIYRPKPSAVSSTGYLRVFALVDGGAPESLRPDIVLKLKEELDSIDADDTRKTRKKTAYDGKRSYILDRGMKP